MNFQLSQAEIAKLVEQRDKLLRSKREWARKYRLKLKEEKIQKERKRLELEAKVEELEFKLSHNGLPLPPRSETQSRSNQTRTMLV